MQYSQFTLTELLEMSVVKLTKHQLKYQMFLTYPLSLFLAFKKGEDGISTQYQPTSAKNYRGPYLDSVHYVNTFICDEERYMTKFNDIRVSLAEIRFEKTRSIRIRHPCIILHKGRQN